MLQDYETDTYTCGVCGKRYAGADLEGLGLRPKATRYEA